MKKTISNMEKIRYEKYSEMGMETINAFYKGVFMNLAEGDDWVSIYLCESKNKGKGEVQEMIGLLREDFREESLWKCSVKPCYEAYLRQVQCRISKLKDNK